MGNIHSNIENVMNNTNIESKLDTKQQIYATKYKLLESYESHVKDILSTFAILFQLTKLGLPDHGISMNIFTSH